MDLTIECLSYDSGMVIAIQKQIIINVPRKPSGCALRTAVNSKQKKKHKQIVSKFIFSMSIKLKWHKKNSLRKKWLIFKWKKSQVCGADQKRISLREKCKN